MTLLQHIENCQELAAEAIRKGLHPETIQCFCVHGASGSCNELSYGHLEKITGEEESGPVIDMEKGTPYVSFYIGN